MDRRHSYASVTRVKVVPDAELKLKRKMSIAVVSKQPQTKKEKPKFKPKQATSRYFWLRSAAPKTHEEIYSKNVDIYLAKLKASRPKREAEFKMREMQWNEIPEGLSNAWTERVAPRAPRVLRQAFDNTEFYAAKEPQLSSVLTDMAVTRTFKSYLEQNKERISDTLKAPFQISEPPATTRGPRRRYL